MTNHADIERLIRLYQENPNDDDTARTLISALERRHGYDRVARSMYSVPVTFEDCLRFVRIIAGSDTIKVVYACLSQQAKNPHPDADTQDSSTLFVNFKIGPNIMLKFSVTGFDGGRCNITVNAYLGKHHQCVCNIGQLNTAVSGFDLLRPSIDNAKTKLAELKILANPPPTAGGCTHTSGASWSTKVSSTSLAKLINETANAMAGRRHG